MSADKYPSIFSRQITLELIPQRFFIFQSEFRHGIKYNLFREYRDLENKFNFNSIV